MIKKAIILFLTIALVSCGAGKRAGKMPTKDAEAVSVIEQYYAKDIDFKTASGRLRAEYQDDEKSQSVNLSFRMEKDKAIWMSASVLGFPVAKAYITPTSVSYYEKITQSYFDGDFTLVSDFVGTPLDFQKLQNLLIGKTIYDLREQPYNFMQSEKGYQFTSEAGEVIKKMFLLNPNFRVGAQQLAQENENRSVTVTYSDFQEVNGKVFPDNIKIIANEAGSSTKIDLTYRSVEFDEEVSFPFEIPSGYEEISLK